MSAAIRTSEPHDPSVICPALLRRLSLNGRCFMRHRVAYSERFLFPTIVRLCPQTRSPNRRASLPRRALLGSPARVMTSAKCRLPAALEAPVILSGASNLLPNVPTVPFSSRPSFMSCSDAASILPPTVPSTLLWPVEPCASTTYWGGMRGGWAYPLSHEGLGRGRPAQLAAG
jgi:hypothetical protein